MAAHFQDDKAVPGSHERRRMKSEQFIHRSNLIAAVETRIGEYEEGSCKRDLRQVLALAKHLHEDLENRKVIERAKERIMEVRRMTGSRAHGLINRSAMSRGVKMVELAQAILDGRVNVECL